MTVKVFRRNFHCAGCILYTVHVDIFLTKQTCFPEKVRSDVDTILLR